MKSHWRKMARRFVLVALMLLVMVVREMELSQGTMKSMTSGFLKTLEQCKQELNLSDHITMDLYHYWKEDYSLLNRETGCAILCMSKKLDMIGGDGKLHHGNTAEFAKLHGAGDDMASKIVTLIHECEKKFEDIEDDCMRILEVAKCFRTDIHSLNWAPKMDVVVTEVLTEI